MKAQIKIKAPVIDMYSTDWEFDGKKGTSHFVVIYDYETHQAERLTLSADDISLFNAISNLALLEEYELVCELNEAYGKVKKILLGVVQNGK
ncbi:hypothetical protein [uncultured Eubacterium sp.]|uniref:hypothetical protein n=1 Tax=uncultured Eubacterium sp. TaxID=165185 RepID=UPI0028039A1E|nr:hypothetical protein [uncultured Eubacterium sp.]